MINAKNELQYRLVSDMLEKLSAAGFLTREELTVAQRLAAEKYQPQAVWQM